jgi:hypothetical protein
LGKNKLLYNNKIKESEIEVHDSNLPRVCNKEFDHEKSLTTMPFNEKLFICKPRSSKYNVE